MGADVMKELPQLLPLGKAVTCSLTCCPSTAGKPTVSRAPGAALPPGAGLPGGAAASRSSTARAWRLRHGFHRKGELPKRKRAFETKQKPWALLPGWFQTLGFGWDLFSREDRGQCEKVRRGTCPSHGHWSAPPAATAEENHSTSEGTTSLSEREMPATNWADQNLLRDIQLTASFAAIITHGQAFVRLIVLGSSSQATAVSFLKSHRSLQEFSNFSRIPMLLFRTILRLLTEKFIQQWWK